MASISIPTYHISPLEIIEFTISISEGEDKKYTQVCEYITLQKFAEALERSDSTPISFPLNLSSEDPENLRIALDDWFFTFSTENWKTLRVYKRILTRATKKGRRLSRAVTPNLNKRSFLRSVFSEQSLPTLDELRNSHPNLYSPKETKTEEQLELDRFGLRLEKGFVPEDYESQGKPRMLFRSASDSDSCEFSSKLESLVSLDELSELSCDSIEYEEILPSPRSNSALMTQAETFLLIQFLDILHSSNSSHSITTDCLQCLLKYSSGDHIYLIRASIKRSLVLDGSISSQNIWSILEGVTIGKEDLHSKFDGINTSRKSLQPLYLTKPSTSSDSHKKNASILCIPIQLQSKYFGSIYIVHHTKEHAFDHVHTPLVTSLGTNLMSLLHSLSLKRNIMKKKAENSTLPCLRKIRNILLQDTIKLYDQSLRIWNECFIVLNPDRLYVFSSPFDSNPKQIILLSEIKKIFTSPVKGRDIHKIIGERPNCTKNMSDYALLYIQTKSQQITWFSCHLFETGHNWVSSIENLLKEIQNNNKPRKIPNNICIKQSDVIVGSIIGKGAAATVFEGYFNQTKVAIKQLLDQFDYSEEKSFFDEMNILKDIHHPNIISLFGGYISETGRPCIVFELAQNGSLSSILYNSNIHITINMKYRFIVQIAQSLVYLHSLNPPIIHRDIKPANILINEDYSIKLADFGLARKCSDNMTPGQGTIKWTAPEILSNASYTIKADIYSFGLIIWEILHQKPFFEEFKFNSQIEIQVVNHKYRPIISESVSTIMIKLIQRCWHQDPTERPTAPIVYDILGKISPEELYTNK